MALDLSAASLIRAGSGALYLGLGVALLASRRRADVAVASLAVLALCSGATFVLVNVFSPDPVLGPVAIAARGACWLVAGGAAVVYAWQASPRARAPWILLGMATGAALFLAGSLGEPDREASFWAIRGVASAIGIGVFVMLPPALAAGSIGAPPQRVRANALVASAFAVYIGYSAGNGILGEASSFGPREAIVVIVATGLGVALWLAVTAQGGGRPARNAALLPAAGMLAGMLAISFVGTSGMGSDGLPRDWGGVGIARILGWTILVYAIVKADILNLDLGKRSIDRSTLAAGALALLFIVAQVAQNFLSASYGLITGGIVAGAFLFAAQPLQRAMERITEGPRNGQAQARGPAGASASESKREAYRRALRVALRDRVLTPEEEVELAHVAHELGLSAPEAVALKHDVERAQRAAKEERR